MPKQWGEALMEGGLALAQMNRMDTQNEIGLEQVRLAKQEDTRQQRAFEVNMAEKKKMQEIRDKPVPVDTLLEMIPAHPETKKKLADTYTRMGYVKTIGGVPITTIGEGQEFLKWWNDNQKFGKEISEGEVALWGGEVEKSKGILMKLMSDPKTKPEDLESAKASYLKASETRQNRIEEHDKLFGKKGSMQMTQPFRTDKGVTVAFNDQNGYVAYEQDAQGNQQIVPYDESRHGRVQKDYAPQMVQTYNPETGEVSYVNARGGGRSTGRPATGGQPSSGGSFVIGPKERGYLLKEGELGADRVKQIVETSNKARNTVVTLDSMNQLLDRFTSGKMAGWEKTAQQWGQALGISIDTKNLGAKEAFTAMSEQLALQSRNMGEGMVLAGQMSDRDVQFLRDMNPQLLISKGGNKLIIKMRQAIAKREMKIADFAYQYKKENRGILDPLGFDSYVKERMSKDSIFGIPDGSALTGTDRITGLPVYKTPAGKLIIPNF